jgi:hypothetical protein
MFCRSDNIKYHRKYGPGGNTLSETLEGKLTGNRRYRHGDVEYDAGGVYGLKDCLVLQVEINTWITGREDMTGRWGCVWRDATPADLTPVEDIVCG